MIRHVVMWKFKEDNKHENMTAFRNMLMALEEKIDEILYMSSGFDTKDSAWDMALVMDFESHAALERYRAHPEHKIVSEFCSTIRIDRCVVDYEI